jgi:L-fuconate dehydratase
VRVRASTCPIFDYLRVGTSLDNRMVEYVDHLHEHFVDPVVVTGRRYRLPTEPRLQRRP